MVNLTRKTGSKTLRPRISMVKIERRPRATTEERLMRTWSKHKTFCNSRGPICMYLSFMNNHKKITTCPLQKHRATVKDLCQKCMVKT